MLLSPKFLILSTQGLLTPREFSPSKCLDSLDRPILQTIASVTTRLPIIGLVTTLIGMTERVHRILTSNTSTPKLPQKTVICISKWSHIPSAPSQVLVMEVPIPLEAKPTLRRLCPPCTSPCGKQVTCHPILLINTTMPSLQDPF